MIHLHGLKMGYIMSLASCIICLTTLLSFIKWNSLGLKALPKSFCFLCPIRKCFGALVSSRIFLKFLIFHVTERFSFKGTTLEQGAIRRGTSRLKRKGEEKVYHGLLSERFLAFSSEEQVCYLSFCPLIRSMSLAVF